MAEYKRILVVGGGISGLATAYYLRRKIKALDLPWEVVGIEGFSHLGGLIQTHQTEKCLIERGPDCFSTERPALIELCRELGLEAEVIETKPSSKGLWLREKDRVYALPASFCGLTSINPATLIRLPCLSLIGKLRMACEGFIPVRKIEAEESLGDFISRRFGEESLRRLAQPFLGSIFGADLRQISLRASFPHWITMEKKHGSLTRAFWAAKRNPSAVISAGFRTLRGGLSDLTQKLSEKSGVTWWKESEVLSLSRSGGGCWHLVREDGHVFSGDAVCLAVSAHKAAPLLNEAFPLLSKKLQKQPARSVILVNAVFERKDWPKTLVGSGLISGLDEAYEVQGASFSSFKFEGRSQDDRVVVRLFGSPLKADAAENKSDAVVQNNILEDFKKIVGISVQPIWSEIKRYAHLLPSYDLNYLNWKQKVEQSVNEIEGLYLSGQSYQPGGLSGCVIAAQTTAEKMVSTLLDSGDKNSNLSREEIVHVHA